MKRSVIFITFICLFILLSGQVLYAADTYQWTDTLYYELGILNVLNQYSLLEDNLHLPEKGTESLSIKAREDLHNLAALYSRPDSTGVTHLTMPKNNTQDEIRLDNQLVSEVNRQGEDKTLTFNPLPGVSIDADIEANRDDLKLETNTNVNLLYKMNEKTQIRAGYGLVSKKWWDVKQISLDEEKTGSDSPNDTFNSYISTPIMTDLIDNTFYDAEKDEKGSLGISVQTSDRVTISADYVNDLFKENGQYSTVFGVEYNDEGRSLKYKYKIDFGESKNTITGLELGINDLATFNASYKFVNTDLLEDQLKESVWDFGVDLNFNERSSLFLGYQVISNKEEQDNPESPENQNKEEKNIKAQLEFTF